MTEVWMDDICPSLPTKSGTALTIPMLATLTLQSTQTDIRSLKNALLARILRNVSRRRKVRIVSKCSSYPRARRSNFPTLSCVAYRLRRRHLDSRNVLPVRRCCVTLNRPRIYGSRVGPRGCGWGQSMYYIILVKIPEKCYSLLL